MIPLPTPETETKKTPIQTRAVNPLLIRAVMETEPIPDYPEFDGEALTLERLDDKKAWGSKAQRRKALAVWRRFVATVNEIQTRRNDKLFKLLLTKGVVLKVPPIAQWGADGDLDLQELGIDDTTPPGTLKLLYLHRLRPDPMDKIGLLIEVMEKSNLPSAPVDDVRALFREALGAVQVTAAPGDKGNQAGKNGNGSQPKPPEFQHSASGLEELDQAIAYDLEHQES